MVSYNIYKHNMHKQNHNEHLCKQSYHQTAIMHTQGDYEYFAISSSMSVASKHHIMFVVRNLLNMKIGKSMVIKL